MSTILGSRGYGMDGWIWKLAAAACCAALLNGCSRVVDIEVPERAADRAPAVQFSTPLPPSPPTAIETSGSNTTAEYRFLEAQPYPLGDWRSSLQGNPIATAIGDVMGDVRNEILMLTLAGPPDSLAHRVLIYRQAADGSLVPPVAMPYSDGLYELANNYLTATVDIADLNRDGRNDIVIGYGKGIAVFLADGRDGFLVSKHLIAPQYRNLPPMFDNHSVSFTEALDVDRDGRLDVVTHNAYQGASIFLGDGVGGFAQAQAMATPIPGTTDVRQGDIDGDGWNDLVVLAGSRNAGKFWTQRNIGQAGFGQPQIYDVAFPDYTYRSIAVGDFDGDRSNEIVVALFSNTGRTPESSARLLEYRRNDAGRYMLSAARVTYDLPLSLEVADMDGDERSDLVIEHHGWEVIGLYLDSLAGSQRLIPLFEYASAPFNPHALSVGDIDGNRCKDVAYPDGNFGLVVVRAEGCRLPRTARMADDCGLMLPVDTQASALPIKSMALPVPLTVGPVMKGGRSSLVP